MHRPTEARSADVYLAARGGELFVSLGSADWPDPKGAPTRFVPAGQAHQLSLFGGFTLMVAGRRAMLPMHARRVLAYLSLQKLARPDCDRGQLAERLWPDSSPERSRASLRTALWRIRCSDPEVVAVDCERVSIADDVAVDVHRFRTIAEQILAARTPGDFPVAPAGLPSATDLLPGWDEEWLVLVREQLRMLRLHALEHGAAVLTAHGRHPQAIDLILQVVDEEPLRESAQAVLINTHLELGNVADARRQFDHYVALLWSQLRLRPSPQLVAVLDTTA